MDPKKRFFSKIPQDFELLEQVPESSYQTGFFWPETIYWDINFVVKCLPPQCEAAHKEVLPPSLMVILRY